MNHVPNPAVLAIHTPRLFQEAVEQVASCLKEGGVAVLPTETVYGLVANALNPEAVGRIFAIKGRPPTNPIIVHVADRAMAQACVRSWPDTADRLASKFWPGPLTLILPRAMSIPDQVTAGGDTVGIRWPFHPFMQAVIRSCDFPLAAPSANLSNAVSPTEPRHVLSSLEDRVPLIVDGGPSQVGIESTVLDLTTSPPRVLRPGMIHAASLAEVIGEVEADGGDGGNTLRSPGLLDRHYAPAARLRVWEWKDERELRCQWETTGLPSDRTHIIAHTVIPAERDWGRVCVIPRDAEAYARALYAELHACDRAGAALIVLEKVPDAEEWMGITDRLRRASH